MLRTQALWQWLRRAPPRQWACSRSLGTTTQVAAQRRRRGDAKAPVYTAPGLIARASQFSDRVALRCPQQGDMTYAELRRRAGGMAVAVLNAVLGPGPADTGAGGAAPGKRRVGRPRHRAANSGLHMPRLRSLRGKPVAFMCEPGHSYVVAQWAIWWAGGVAVPMCTSHPLPELLHVVKDSGAVAVVADPTHLGTVIELVTEHLDRTVAMLTVFEPMAAEAIAPLPQLTPASPATIMYTSGT